MILFFDAYALVELNSVHVIKPPYQLTCRNTTFARSVVSVWRFVFSEIWTKSIVSEMDEEQQDGEVVTSIEVVEEMEIIVEETVTEEGDGNDLNNDVKGSDDVGDDVDIFDETPVKSKSKSSSKSPVISISKVFLSFCSHNVIVSGWRKLRRRGFVRRWWRFTTANSQSQTQAGMRWSC